MNNNKKPFNGINAFIFWTSVFTGSLVKLKKCDFLGAILPKRSYHGTSFARLSSPGTHLTAESTEAMRIKCLAQGHNVLLPGFEPSTSVSIY